VTSVSARHKADVLTEALPYIRAFSGKTIVVKYGGAAMVEPERARQFAEDVVLMQYVGMLPVIVHGGGPQISAMMKRLGKEPRFIDGVRVTDAATMEIVEMVLAGRINKEIVTGIQQCGGRAVGLTGKDGALLQAEKIKGFDKDNVGHVGAVATVDPSVLSALEAGGFIPVISPIGADRKGVTYNINADQAAGAIAAAIRAEKFIILTDVPGILDREKTLISTLSRKEAGRLIKSGVIAGGMLPKVEAALTAVEAGVRKAHIVDGRVPHALLLEILTNEGVGTEILA